MASGKNNKTNCTGMVSLFITKKGAALFGAVTAIIGGLGMVGWIPGMQFLGRIRLDFIPMAPSTAVSFILVGLIQALHSRWNWKSGGKAIVILIVVLVSIFGLLEVAELYTGISLNFEDVIVPEKGTLAGVPVARMSPSTGGAFLIAGLSLLLHLFHTWSEKNHRC